MCMESCACHTINYCLLPSCLLSFTNTKGGTNGTSVWLPPAVYVLVLPMLAHHDARKPCIKPMTGGGRALFDETRSLSSLASSGYRSPLTRLSVFTNTNTQRLDGDSSSIVINSLQWRQYTRACGRMSSSVLSKSSCSTRR